MLNVSWTSTFHLITMETAQTLDPRRLQQVLTKIVQGLSLPEQEDFSQKCQGFSRRASALSSSDSQLPCDLELKQKATDLATPSSERPKRSLMWCGNQRPSRSCTECCFSKSAVRPPSQGPLDGLPSVAAWNKDLLDRMKTSCTLPSSQPSAVRSPVI